MICKFCGQDKKLIDAHIIARVFFECMRPDKKEPFEVVTNVSGVRNTISRIGIYDNELLCADCEKIFQKYDDYGQMVLLRTEPSDIFKDKEGNILAWQWDGVDYNKLKLFFLSVLWRASASNKTPHCNIGDKFEGIIKNMFINGTLENDNFDCILSRHNDCLGQNYFLDPVSKTKLKNSPINFAVIYLGVGYKLYIKVDQRRLDDEELFKVSFRENGPLYVLKSQDFINSKEFEVLKNLL